MVPPELVRNLALALPQAVEGAHHGHADFRVHGKIFATLRPDDGAAVVKLPAIDQEALLATDPASFTTNAWSKQGWLEVRLDAVSPERMREALEAAWSHVAPARLVARHDAARRNR